VIISNAALRNRVVVGVLVFLISLAGVYSYLTLPRESAPDVPIPMVMVMTPYNGVAPEDIESSVTMKIESKLTGIKGVKEVRSTSAEGLSMVMVEFQPDVRIEDALQLVRDKVDQAKADLPTGPDIQAPVASEINISEFPILYLSISGPISPVMLKDIGDKLKDAIEQNVTGVLNVEVMGGLEREIRLEIDPARVAFYNLTIPEIMTLIPSEHVNISAGGLETQGTKFNVRIPAEFKEAKDITHIPLASRNGRQIFLSDVATVTDTFKDRQTISRLNGESSITVAVQKRVGANILELVDGVKKVVDEGKKRVPQAVKFTYTMDQSKEIKLMVADLENNIGAALVLVMTIMLIAIGLRASLVVALAVPLSMFMSFAVLDMMGALHDMTGSLTSVTLNMVVLFSLVLSVGMLVDDAIVIVENIYRHMQMGKGRMRAAREATAEVAWPVITSTLTTCAAFLPMVFWPGVMGSFFKYLPITLITTLLSSLFVAMVVSPVVCTLVPGKAHEGKRDNFILRGYRRFLTLAVSHRGLTLGLCCIMLVGMVILYAKKGRGVEFFPDIDPKNAIINLRCPQGTNITQTDALAREVERRIQKRLITPENPNGEIEQIVANIGSDSSGAGMMFGGNAGGPQEGTLTLVFPDFEERHKSSAKTIADIRADLMDLPGVEVKVEKEQGGPQTGAAVTVRLIGEDLNELQRINVQARTLIQNVPGLVNLRSDLELTRPELVIKPDRERARAANVDTATIGNFLKTGILGSKVGSYRVGNDEYDITVRLPASQRESIQKLLQLRVPSATGSAVPLSSVTKCEYRGGLGTINRVDRKRVITLTGDAEGRLNTEVLGDVQEILSKYGRNGLISEDVSNWKALLEKLNNGSTLATRIMGQLDKEGQALVGNNTSDLSDGQKKQIAAALSKVLADPALLDEALAKELNLDPEVLELLAAKKPGIFAPSADKIDFGRQVLRRNRLALEALAGGAIKPAVRMDLGDGYEIKYAGQDEEMQKAMSFLLKAFVIALILIVLIMVAQFNTLSVPFVIMTTVLLSLIGVLIGLVSTGTPFGVIMTGIGVISLAGVVVKNGIVLMDYTRQLQKKGLGVVQACVEAGTIRLRPVLLTAACTVLGLVPVALGWTFDFHTMHWTQSEASQWWVSMAVAVIFGLSFATVLTLVVVPCLYVMLFSVASKLGMGGLQKDEEEAEAEADQAVPATSLVGVQQGE